MDQSAVQAEIAAHEARKGFWASIHRDFPLTQGHQELADSLLVKHAEEIGPMTIPEAVDFLGSRIEAEVLRRTKRDTDGHEARAYRGGPAGIEHGSGFDGRTGAAIAKEDNFQPEEGSLGDLIRQRREARRTANKRFQSSPRADRREHGRV
jgi:hypothetical protein